MALLDEEKKTSGMHNMHVFFCLYNKTTELSAPLEVRFTLQRHWSNQNALQ